MPDLDATLARLAALAMFDMPADAAPLRAELGAMLDHLTALAQLDTSGLDPFVHDLAPPTESAGHITRPLSTAHIARLAPDARQHHDETFVAVPSMHTSHEEPS